MSPIGRRMTTGLLLLISVMAEKVVFALRAAPGHFQASRARLQDLHDNLDGASHPIKLVGTVLCDALGATFGYIGYLIIADSTTRSYYDMQYLDLAVVLFCGCVVLVSALVSYQLDVSIYRSWRSTRRKHSASK